MCSRVVCKISYCMKISTFLASQSNWSKSMKVEEWVVTLTSAIMASIWVFKAFGLVIRIRIWVVIDNIRFLVLILFNPFVLYPNLRCHRKRVLVFPMKNIVMQTLQVDSCFVLEYERLKLSRLRNKPSRYFQRIYEGEICQVVILFLFFFLNEKWLVLPN